MKSYDPKEELPEFALKEITLRAWTEEETPRFVELLEQQHYLKAPMAAQRLVCQVALYRGVPVALLTWTIAARRLHERETYIGWDQYTRARRLHFIAQNNRFLILHGVRQPNLASKVLALAVKHLPEPWEKLYEVKPLLVESFVDPERYQGTCYKAAGWFMAGHTAGYGRQGDYYVKHDKPKHLWLKELEGGARARLSDPHTELPGEKKSASGQCPVSAKVCESLNKALYKVPDPRTRRGRQFPLPAMLATAVLALACGARTVSDIYRFCRDLTGPQRSNLGFRRNPQAHKVVPTPGEGCWRDVLSRVDYMALEQCMNEWQIGQFEGMIPDNLSIDGKVIAGNLATLVSLVECATGTPVAQVAAPGRQTGEQTLVRTLLSSLGAELDGKTIMADAGATNEENARLITQELGAHYVLQLKDNQPGVSERAKILLESQSAPPFCTHPSKVAMAGL